MNKNYRINELMGAKIFRKGAFKLEEIKFKVVDKFFPNTLEKYEKNLRKSLEKSLCNAKNDEERQVMIRNYQNKILTARKEFNDKRNRNYHIRMDNPNEFVNHLKNNKKIHVKGLIRNGIAYVGIVPLIIFGSSVLVLAGYLALVYNIISTFINFQCINLQNYNLKRFEESRERLDEIRKKRQIRDLKKYGEISKVVSKEFDKTEAIPSIEDVVSNITTKEQLEQMRNLLKVYYPNVDQNNEQKANSKVKC